VWRIASEQEEPGLPLYYFRGVSYDRLPQILDTGVDVVPRTERLFVGEYSKAWEYGGLPKVMMAFDREKVSHRPPCGREPEGYEREYGIWIDKDRDPWEALRSVIIFIRPSDKDSL